MPDNFRLLRGENAEYVLIILLVLTVVLLFALLMVLVRMKRMTRRLDALTHGIENADLEHTLIAHMDIVDQSVRRMDTLEQAVGVLQAQMPSCLQRVNMVRYDAFEDVGGEQSFSLALLDAQRNGVVITSVYSRMDVRVYAKPILNGRTTHNLSREEERAIRELAVN